MSLLIRYCLLQLPGLTFLVGLLVWIVFNGWLSATAAGWILIVWMLKDAALYPLYKPALEAGPAIGTQALIGREARTGTALAPRGWLSLDGERWQARGRGGEYIAPQTRVRIVDADRLVLIVEPLAAPPGSCHIHHTMPRERSDAAER